ncbi:MAG TPA: VCBS repeat-containing protein [Kineosporiaceae bacterium]|nr:VCBS repeat-containing protein [Kineosporiaceae bacterium]
MRTGKLGRVAVRGLCVVLMLGGTVAGLSGHASAAACDLENPSNRGDIDGDGMADVAVGMPGYADGSGAVDIRLSDSPSVLLRASDLGAGTGEGDGFGAAIAVADLDRDGCADLVIGAPAEGQVHLVFGRPGGLDTSTSITLMHNSSDLDFFGSSVAVVSREDEVLERSVWDIYAGAPRATVNGHKLAGEVFRYSLEPNSAGRVTATLREVRSQDSAGVPGSSEDGDGFGSVLASVGRGGVLVSAPDENVGSARDAGAVWFLRVNADGEPITSQRWTQDSVGVPGTAETGDHFGAALGSRHLTAVIGVPGEDSGSHQNSGMIQTLRQKSVMGAFSIGEAMTQDTAGVPGVAETGDRFGAAVTVGLALLCQESTDVAVGIPGKDLGTRKDAGAITLIALGTPGACPSKVLRQGSGLAGAAETGDQVGAVLGLTQGTPTTDADDDLYADRLLIGIPKEDIGAVIDAGMVLSSGAGLVSDGVAHTSLTFSKGSLLSNNYGMRLTSLLN